jgi:sulfate transport system permease protein
MPPHVQLLYDNYDYVGAFTVAAILALLALLTLGVKTFLEWRYADELAASHRH